MTRTKAQIIVLHKKIAEEMHDEKDEKVLEDYIERIRRTAWLEPILRPHLSTW